VGRERPVFLHNDDRIDTLAAVIGITLLIFGPLATDLRARLRPAQTMPGLLSKHRAAKPTGRNILTHLPRPWTHLHHTRPRPRPAVSHPNGASSPSSTSHYPDPNSKTTRACVAARQLACW
jgi:hypothetical protein